MRIHNKKIKQLIFSILLICIFILFPYKKVFAETERIGGVDYTYAISDDGTEGADIKSVQIMLTTYGDAAGGSGFYCGLNSGDLAGYGSGDPNSSDKYDKYQWGYFLINGEKYVAMAGALRSYLSSPEWGKRWGLIDRTGRKYTHIHYFNTSYNMGVDQCDKIQFRFVDQSFDSETYSGIIVDTGPAMMLPQRESLSTYTTPDDKMLNAIDVYMGANGESISSPLSGQIIVASMDGSFSMKNNGQKVSQTDFLSDIIARVIALIGDGIQIILDFIGTEPEEFSWEQVMRVKYSMDEISSMPNLNNQIQVNHENENLKDQILSRTLVDNMVTDTSGNSEEAFTTDTKIPVIPVDMYTSIVKSKILKIDFFELQGRNKNGIMGAINKLIQIINKVILAFTAAGLMTMLIYRSILLIVSTLGYKPKNAAKAKNLMNQFVNAVIWLIGIILFMMLCNTLYNAVFEKIVGNNPSYFPIRVDVNNVYTYNTNIIGLLKYQSLSTYLKGKVVRSLIYLAGTLLNASWFIYMVKRALILAGLTAIAPMVSIYKMLDEEKQNKMFKIFDFKLWSKIYLQNMWYPIIIMYILKLVLGTFN